MLFDFGFVLVISTATTVIIAVQLPNWIGAAYLFPVSCLYGLAATLTSYAVTTKIRSEAGAFLVSLSVLGIQFGVTIVLYIVRIPSFNLADV